MYFIWNSNKNNFRNNKFIKLFILIVSSKDQALVKSSNKESGTIYNLLGIQTKVIFRIVNLLNYLY